MERNVRSVALESLVQSGLSFASTLRGFPLSWFDEYAICLPNIIKKRREFRHISALRACACGWQSIPDCAALAFKGTYGFSRMAEHQFTIRHKAATAASAAAHQTTRRN
jgi:hypothetical protein